MKNNKEDNEKYHKKNPYAASHPYSKGPKLKPDGAPAPYKKKVAKKMGESKDLKNQKAGYPWGLKVNKISKEDYERQKHEKQMSRNADRFSR